MSTSGRNQCVDCSIPIHHAATRCRACRKKLAKVWTCIDCGATVGRKVMRCPPCCQKYRKERTPYVRTPEIRQQMSEILAGKPKPHMRGRKRPEHSRYMRKEFWTPERREAARIHGELMAENREWIMQIALALTGEKNPNYQGKNNASGYAPGWGRAYRKKLIARANGICERCGKAKKLEPHHRDFSKSNHAEDNILIVCRSCHKLLHAANSRKT